VVRAHGSRTSSEFALDATKPVALAKHLVDNPVDAINFHLPYYCMWAVAERLERLALIIST